MASESENNGSIHNRNTIMNSDAIIGVQLGGHVHSKVFTHAGSRLTIRSGWSFLSKRKPFVVVLEGIGAIAHQKADGLIVCGQMYPLTRVDEFEMSTNSGPANVIDMPHVTEKRRQLTRIH